MLLRRRVSGPVSRLGQAGRVMKSNQGCDMASVYGTGAIGRTTSLPHISDSLEGEAQAASQTLAAGRRISIFCNNSPKLSSSGPSLALTSCKA